MLLRILLPLVGIIICLPVSGQPIDLSLDVSRHELRNGLQILTIEDHNLPVISYYTFYKVGSRNEQAGLTGISHLFEHMMFNGARRYGPKVFDQMMESNGGFANAYTNEDVTVYHESVPSDRLEMVIDLESDRMGHLALTAKSLISEREVVKEERRLRVDNSVVGGVFELLHATAYTAHPYGWPVLGWMSDIDRISIEDCRDYFKTYYTPSNALIVLVGDFETQEAIDLIRLYYERLPSQPPPLPIISEEPPQYGERRAKLYKYAEIPALAIGYHAPSTRSKDIFALDVLQMILAQGESSRLYRRLVYEEQTALSVSAIFPWMTDPSLFTIYITVKPNRETTRVEEVVYEEIDRFKKQTVTGRELRKAKNILQALLVEELETNSGKADNIGTYELLFGDWSVLISALDRYEEVTTDDIIRVANIYFPDRNRTVITMIPESQSE